MSRILVCVVALLAAAPQLGAQTTAPLGEPLLLRVSPAALPVPSLKYRIVSDAADLVPGNAAGLVYRSEALLVESPPLLQSLRSEQWTMWMVMPVQDLPREEIRGRLRDFRPVLRELDEARRRSRCDWQLAGRPEGITLLLPEVQGIRELANVLAVCARYAMAEGHFPEALEALQTGYALGRHMGQGPSLIHVLVGAAIISIMDRQLEDLIQQPGAPNLYWALAVLPRPFIDTALAIEEDGAMVERTFPFAQRLDQGPMSPDEVRAAEGQLRDLSRRFGFGPSNVAETLGQAWRFGAVYSEAKRALVSQGLPAEQVEAMPVFQVDAAYVLREYRRTWEEYAKWFTLPEGWRSAGCRQSAQRFKAAEARLNGLFFPGDRQGDVPRLEKVHLALDRVERRFVSLRCVEAVREYAAGHGGKLPAALGDVTLVPVPLDPVTGKPFEYEVKGDKARLDPPSTGVEEPKYQMIRYEITVRR